MKLISIFDVETSGLPPDQLAKVKPVLVANRTLKDPIKIADDLVVKYDEWLERAALDATTGQVLCISTMDAEQNVDIIHAGEERDNIERFWNWLELRLARSETVVGFNIFGFDLPFLIQRSWLLDVEVPKLMSRNSNKFWPDWHGDLICLMQKWQLGNREKRISLDTLSKALGIGAKNGSGAEFAALWASDREKALEYCRNDLALTRKCAERLLGLK